MNDLMTLDEIAQMHHCSMRHARDVLVKLAGFPQEAPTSTPRNRLWLRGEVRASKPRELLAEQKKKDAEAFLKRCDEIDARSAANRRHHRAKRRTAQMQRTPAWADLNAIERVYREAVRLESETGIDHAVDHIIPLQGRRVSGLHVAANLQVLPATVNLSKGNRFEVQA